MDTLSFFGLNLGKLPNYVQYFASNVVEGIAESWVEAEMSWVEAEMSWVEVDGAEWSSVELGAGFSNTHLNISYSYYHLQCLKNNL